MYASGEKFPFSVISAELLKRSNVWSVVAYQRRNEVVRKASMQKKVNGFFSVSTRYCAVEMQNPCMKTRI